MMNTKIDEISLTNYDLSHSLKSFFKELVDHEMQCINGGQQVGSVIPASTGTGGTVIPASTGTGGSVIPAPTGTGGSVIAAPTGTGGSVIAAPTT